MMETLTTFAKGGQSEKYTYIYIEMPQKVQLDFFLDKSFTETRRISRFSPDMKDRFIVSNFALSYQTFARDCLL